VIAAGGLAGLFVLFHGSALLHERTHLFTALSITLAFALIARLTRGVSASGTLAGAVVAFLMASRDLAMFWMLLVVFAVTLAATRLRGPRKKQLQVAESENGRSASQVMANLGIAGLIMAAPAFQAWRLLALAALAEAAADTVSSEVGTAFRGRAVLITNWRAVEPGVDGGVSLNGTLAALSAAGIVALCGGAMGLANPIQMLIIAGAGTLGMFIDSFLGGGFEGPGYLTNDQVNLLGTASAVLIAWLLIR
jgi:uncharacterized protein (TIGR00297 family)